MAEGFLDTRGKQHLGIGICDRCKGKFPIDELYDDPNARGLKVCIADVDDFDPYRLQPRAADDIVLRFPRPDEPI